MLKIETLEELHKLVQDQVAESLTLEFKASPALNKSSDARSELVKDVTALANSAGGQIVYGIVERGGVPRSIDDGVDSEQISIEWIGQVLDTNAAPRVQGIRITRIAINEHNSQMAAYVIAIPQATAFAPHQNGIDKKYYRRFENRSVPMHDYEIRDLLRRGQTPELRGRLTFSDGTFFIPYHQRDRPVQIVPVMENLSSEPSLYSLFDFGFDSRLQMVSDAGLKRMRDAAIGEHKFWQLQKSFVVPNEFPLLKGSSVTIGPPYISILIPSEFFGQSEAFLLTCATLAAGSKSFQFATLVINGHALSLTTFRDVEGDG